MLLNSVRHAQKVDKGAKKDPAKCSTERNAPRDEDCIHWNAKDCETKFLNSSPSFWTVPLEIPGADPKLRIS